MSKCIPILLPVAALLLSGCIHSYYMPNSHHVPLLTEKKDARIAVNFQSASADLMSSVPVFELQGSYAVGNHIGVMATFLNGSRNVDVEYARTRYGDLGLGYFMTNRAKNLVVECYGGFGWGFAENGFVNDATSGADYTKVFFQPAVGFTSPYVDAVISLRGGSVHHSSIQSQGTLTGQELTNFENLSTHPTHFVWEPAITLRGGSGPFKLQLQGGLSDSDRHQGKGYISVGLFVSLPLKKRD